MEIFERLNNDNINVSNILYYIKKKKNLRTYNKKNYLMYIQDFLILICS